MRTSWPSSGMPASRLAKKRLPKAWRVIGAPNWCLCCSRKVSAFDLSHELERISGVDLTRIDGIEVMVAQTVLSEVGLDMSRWKTEAHFSSLLGLCPDNRISGDRVLRRGTRKVINRAATA